MINLDNFKSKLPKINLPDLSISEEAKTKIKNSFSAAGKTAVVVAKYGSVFGSGVLLGTILGIVLFFKISADDI